MAAAEKYPPKIRCERNLVSHLTAVPFSRLLRMGGRRQLCFHGMGGRWGRSPVGAVGVWLLVVIAPICQMMIVAV